MYVLGISAFYHDSAACLVYNGKIVAAVQEERFTRKKHDWDFPKHSIKYCLDAAGIDISKVSYIAFYDKPFLKFERILETYLTFAPRGLKSFLKSMPLWIKQKIWVKHLIQDELSYSGPILFPEHHLSHAASAFFASPFKSSAFLTVDGVGEWTTTSYGVGSANKLGFSADIKFPHSLGLLYSAFTYYAGFKVNSGEYKLMGLAPYGKPIYKDLILNHLIDVKVDGSYRLNLKYFDFCVGSRMTNKNFDNLFGGPPRKPESKVRQKDMDIARSIQEALEEIMLKIANHIHRETKEENLCLSGGVALNCVCNGKLLRNGPFKNIWVQPASGDAGGALGAALFVYYQYLNNVRETSSDQDFQQGSYLGPDYSNDYIQAYLDKNNIVAKQMDDETLLQKISDLILEDKVIGWFQGRMEFGPRALGSRSIIGNAASAKLQEVMNLKIKYRESFRPFAPAIKDNRISDFFDMQSNSPYMMFVSDIQENQRKVISDQEKNLFGIDLLKVERSTIPAITHVDYSARIQTVHKDTNPLFYRLLEILEERVDLPLVINTSFNVRGEPIVMTPEDAYRCFMRTEMDYLVLGNYLLEKVNQSAFSDKSNWKKEFVLD